MKLFDYSTYVECVLKDGPYILLPSLLCTVPFTSLKPSTSKTMAKHSMPKDSSDESLSNSLNSSEEEQVQVNEEEDEEELEAVARTADFDEDDAAEATGDDQDEEDNEVDFRNCSPSSFLTACARSVVCIV